LQLALSLAVVTLGFGVSASQAQADGSAIVSAAQAMQSAGYPYCFDGGSVHGPTVGIADPDPDPEGSYSNCSQIGRVGFDCTGLTLYAVYQGTGNAGLSHDGYQAQSGGGQVVANQSELQPGDIVYFDYNAAHGLGYIDHAGIYVGGGKVLSAVSEKWGIRTESIAWYEAGGLHFVGAKRYWSGGGTPPSANGGSAIVGSQSGRCVDVPNADTAPGTQLQIWDCNGGAQQQWIYQAGQLKVYGSPTMCLDATAQQLGENGTRVQIWPCNGGANQQWIGNADGTIRSAASGRCLDANGASTANGTPLQLWDCNGGLQQQWSGGIPSANGGSAMPVPTSVASVHANGGVTAAPVANGGVAAVRVVTECVVPRVLHEKLNQAKRRLRLAHCGLGRVTRIPHGHSAANLRVARQSVGPGSHRPSGYSVNLVLKARS
jgi:cell wall-associated NlpC family hydrolase